MTSLAGLRALRRISAAWEVVARPDAGLRRVRSMAQRVLSVGHGGRELEVLIGLAAGGFEKLASGADPFATTAPEPPPPPTVAELLEQGETLEVEFKSSVFHSFKPDVPEKVITGSIIKTIAAFLNSQGGTLVIGVTDDGVVVGVEPDLTLKKFDLDKYENALRTILINAIGAVPASKCRTRFETVDGKIVCLVDVDAAMKPTYADSDKGKGVFFVRHGNTTRQLDTKETVEYIADRWGLA